MTTVEVVTIVADPGWTGELGTLGPLLRGLERLGLPARARHAVAADEASAERAVRHAVAGGGLVLVLGDDEGSVVARGALARILGTRLVLSPRALEALEALHAGRQQAMPRRAEALALVPTGAAILVPASGGEPGLLAEVGGALVALLPAGPEAALRLVEEHVLPRWPSRMREPVTVTRTLRLVGLDRAEVDARLGAALRGMTGASGQVVDAGDEVWVRLRLRGPLGPALGPAPGPLDPALREAFGLAWYGDGDEPLEGVVGGLLRARGFTVALAESCTGGLVGHRLTEIAGSSDYLERGLVAYSNAAKRELLGVPDEILASHGAVSAECARAMASGARARAGTDLGLSITGIAGPGGATPTKPVGTVFIALADARTVTVEHHRFDRDRAGNKALSATRALDLLRRHCLGRG